MVAKAVLADVVWILKAVLTNYTDAVRRLQLLMLPRIILLTVKFKDMYVFVDMNKALYFLQSKNK